MPFLRPRRTNCTPNNRPPKLPTKALRSNGRRMSETYPVPLTVLAELLYCEISTPYKAAKRFGLREWLHARVRGFMTSGGGFCTELDLEQAIRFNTAYLEKRARFVLARKEHHGGRLLDAEALAKVLELTMDTSGWDFLDMWLTFLRSVANDLIAASRRGYAEDVPWPVAEKYLDRQVGPRPRMLSKAKATPDPSQAPDGPVSTLGGNNRMRRVLDRTGSKDPAIVAATLQSRDFLRYGYPDWCDAADWCDAHEGMDDLDPR